MQISRHWRLNSQRYRLQGVRYENGETSLQNRPEIPSASGIGYAAHMQLKALTTFEGASNKEGAKRVQKEVA